MGGANCKSRLSLSLRASFADFETRAQRDSAEWTIFAGAFIGRNKSAGQLEGAQGSRVGGQVSAEYN